MGFNPRSPCGERQRLIDAEATSNNVSIRAPRVGSDIPCTGTSFRKKRFNPRSPCGERPYRLPVLARRSGFNPRSPCGERRLTWPTSFSPTSFNPRSPCGERLFSAHIKAPRRMFQSALPVWGATHRARRARSSCRVSIRAPRVGSDPITFDMLPADEVSIRAPRVGSDDARLRQRQHREVSLRAPRVGSDYSNRLRRGFLRGFNPRSPCGERL